MKKIVLSIMLLGTLFFASAQSGNAGKSFETTMLSHIRQLDTAASGSSLKALANAFERIGLAENTKWQPYYYAAYCYTVVAFTTPDKTLIDPLADKAEALLLKATALEKNNSELTCLQAMITSCRIVVDPVARFGSLGKEVFAALDQAKLEDPKNPRIYLMEARLRLRMPEAFGGGKTIARRSAEIAVDKFKTFVPGDSIAPSWGANQASALLANINAQ